MTLEVWVIVLIMFLMLLGLVFLYLRFQGYRKVRRDRFRRDQERARAKGLVVPDEVAKALHEEVQER